MVVQREGCVELKMSSLEASIGVTASAYCLGEEIQTTFSSHCQL